MGALTTPRRGFDWKLHLACSKEVGQEEKANSSVVMRLKNSWFLLCISKTCDTWVVGKWFGWSDRKDALGSLGEESVDHPGSLQQRSAFWGLVV